MIDLAYDTSTDQVRLVRAVTIKAGSPGVPVRLTFSSAPTQTVSDIQIALGTEGASPSVLAFNEDFTAESSTVWTATLDANDTRLVNYMNGRKQADTNAELVLFLDGERQAYQNITVTVQPPVINGPETSEGGPTYLTDSETRAAIKDLETVVATPLVSRRLQNGQNVRVLILGDSIAQGVLWADGAGALRIAQDVIGNAGGGGEGVNSELVPAFGGGAAFSTDFPSDWFKKYYVVPSSGTAEFSDSFQFRHWANTAKVAWRAPVGGTATFKIQTCSDADGAGLGTWVDQGGVRTAVASGASEEVGYVTISLTEGKYRVRVLGVSGTVHVFHMELSHSATGGIVILNQSQGGTTFESWAALTDTQRQTFLAAIDPDVVFLICKDNAETMETSLPVLASTLEAVPSGSYPRDLVILAPFPSVLNNDPLGDAGGVMMYEQRNEMRTWCANNRANFIDLWLLGPAANIYYADGVHLAGTSEYAHMGRLILERLGWLDYPKVKLSRLKSTPIAAYTEVTDTTTLYEFTDLRIRGLSAGRWRIKGEVQFSHGATGQGGKVEIGVVSNSALVSFLWEKCGNNATPSTYVFPSVDGSAYPFLMSGATGFVGGAFAYRVDTTITVTSAGDLIVKIAKEATGGAVYIREGSYLIAEKVS